MGPSDEHRDDRDCADASGQTNPHDGLAARHGSWVPACAGMRWAEGKALPGAGGTTDEYPTTLLSRHAAQAGTHDGSVEHAARAVTYGNKPSDGEIYVSPLSPASGSPSP
jgi:hypothetical protein